MGPASLYRHLLHANRCVLQSIVFGTGVNCFEWIQPVMVRGKGNGARESYIVKHFADNPASAGQNTRSANVGVARIRRFPRSSSSETLGSGYWPPRGARA